MKPFGVLEAVAVPFDEANVDTDQLVPGRFLTRPVFPEVMLYDRRFASDGSPRPDFVLNDPAYAGAEIFIAGRNFGVGSSREAAAQSLPAAGFRCVIAPSFGDIFFSNCLQIGVLPIALPEADVAALLRAVEARPGLRVRVDLPAQTVAAPGCGPFRFSINAKSKACLVEGLDDVALTARYAGTIAAFETSYYADFPWLA
jgi:3-isopropylmalate/(R)-2-methylmalate dehydratase small subunit